MTRHWLVEKIDGGYTPRVHIYCFPECSCEVCFVLVAVSRCWARGENKHRFSLGQRVSFLGEHGSAKTLPICLNKGKIGLGKSNVPYHQVLVLLR